MTPARDPVVFGPEIIGAGFRVRQVDYAAGYRQPPHDHDTIGITLVLAGGFRERAHGREEYASALSVVVKPAGTVHDDLVDSRGARTVLVEIEDAAAALEDARDLGPWRWLHAGPGVAPLLGLRHALLDPVGGPDPGEMVHELLGAIVRDPFPALGDAPAWVRRAREALDDHAPEGLGVGELASRLGVHPVSLTRAFRRAYGVPITVYRSRLRLRLAAAEVVGTDLPLSRIAHAAGYADQAHMCRKVRDATRLTPGRLRRIAGG